MNISLIDNGGAIRQAFIEKFTVLWHKSNSHPTTHKNRYLWELMDHRAVSFATALVLLRSMTGEVLFMSEIESKPSCQGIRMDGTERKGCVTKMNAAQLAGLIEYEWNEGWRLSALNMHFPDAVLPDDLYVFDAAMEHLLVFTHETDCWGLELEQPMKAAESRFCMMCGFELPEEQGMIQC